MRHYYPLDQRITKGVRILVEGYCADYPRRKRVAECRYRTITTDEEVLRFKAINEKIDLALEIVDEGMRTYILTDIANGNGYTRSMASPFMHRDTYYKLKNAVILRIAELMNLIL
jgi:hypothetical protein